MKSKKLTAILSAIGFCVWHSMAKGSSSPVVLYVVGDGEVADFALEVRNNLDAFLYLTRKPVNEPIDGASVSLQSNIGGDDLKFVPVKGSVGVYYAKLPSLTLIPGQVLIQTADETDAIETVIPSYKQAQVASIASVPTNDYRSHGQLTAPQPMVLAFICGVVLTLLFVAWVRLVKRRRGGTSLVVVAAVGMGLAAGFSATTAIAHEGHEHGAPSLDGDADTGSEVVMPKKSQILIGLRTVVAKKQRVPGVIKAYGHIIPKPQLDAAITAPQAGFLRGTRGLTLGTKVQRGQLLGTLQAVGQIRLESPIDGEVSEISAVDGARVEVGGKIIRITNPSILWVDAELFADQLVELGQVTEVSIAVGGVSEPVRARLLHAQSPISEETRTAKVFLELVSPPLSLRIGMLSTVSFALARTTDSIPLPTSVVLNRAGDLIVFVQTGPETFSARQVIIEDGPTSGVVLLAKGVKQGERVVISGNYQLLMKAK